MREDLVEEVATLDSEAVLGGLEAEAEPIRALVVEQLEVILL